MSFHRKRQAVARCVWLQCPVDLTDESRQGFITHPYPRSPQYRTDHHPPYEELWRGEARDSFLSAHAYVTEPGDLEKRLESRGITKTKGRSQQPCSSGTDVSLGASSQGVMPWTALNVTPHSDGETTARNEHAERFS